MGGSVLVLKVTHGGCLLTWGGYLGAPPPARGRQRGRSLEDAFPLVALVPA
jgi:hypothetical protein